MLSISEVDNATSRVIVLRTHLSGELVKASDEIVPTMVAIHSKGMCTIQFFRRSRIAKNGND